MTMCSQLDGHRLGKRAAKLFPVILKGSILQREGFTLTGKLLIVSEVELHDRHGFTWDRPYLRRA